MRGSLNGREANAGRSAGVGIGCRRGGRNAACTIAVDCGLPTCRSLEVATCNLLAATMAAAVRVPYGSTPPPATSHCCCTCPGPQQRCATRRVAHDAGAG
jgi:hypothetical protein